MIRGTTPTHTFRLPVPLTELKKVRVSYAQDETVVLTKELDDCAVVDENSIVIKLSQEDTLKFNHKKLVRVQLKALTLQDEAVATSIYIVSVEECLDSEVLA